MIPELLAPAGSPEALDAAIGEGADAVYLGLKSFNARMRSANFAYSQFEGCLRTLHNRGRKVYVTVNTVFEQREADRVYQLLKYLAGLEPDGIIVQDFGVVAMVRENFPSLKLHASTQMNIASARGVNLLSRYGFSRAVLARELSLEEIRGIRANTNLELEVFVHGALCMSVSGICLFSSYLGGKSANRGMCTQACRRIYNHGGESGAPVEEGYYFSPGDLQLIEKIPDISEAGINSLKIEGRMKSAEYVGTVVSAYRLVLDNLDAGGEALANAVREAEVLLRGDFARPKTKYLIGGTGTGGDTGIDWLNPNQAGGTGIPMGRLLGVRGPGGDRQGRIAPGPAVPAAGDSLRFHKADDSRRLSCKVLFIEKDSEGSYWISIPEGFEPGDAVYLIQTKAMTKRYQPVSPGDLSRFKRSPGRDKAPAVPVQPAAKVPPRNGQKHLGKGQGHGFPEGLYVQVSRLEDLYALQSVRPVKVMLNYNRRHLSRLLGYQKQPLPFGPDDLIITLDPFFPQSDDAVLAEDLSALTEKGYRHFMINNAGHFSFFRGNTAREPGISFIAGPWLYMFNQWALSFIAANGAACFVSPLENNRQNLERTVPGEIRNRVFITVYSRPGLFRIRTDLSNIYSFKKFSGSRDEAFRLLTSPEGSMVYPEKPFYIADKIPFLAQAGFGRFILDLSAEAVKKTEYRDLMETVRQAVPLRGAGRFNWKDGFYQKD
jgi:putative protease